MAVCPGWCNTQSLCCIVGGEGGGRWKEYGFHFIEELPQTSSFLLGGGGEHCNCKSNFVAGLFQPVAYWFLFFFNLINQNWESEANLHPQRSDFAVLFPCCVLKMFGQIVISWMFDWSLQACYISWLKRLFFVGTSGKWRNLTLKVNENFIIMSTYPQSRPAKNLRELAGNWTQDRSAWMNENGSGWFWCRPIWRLVCHFVMRRGGMKNWRLSPFAPLHPPSPFFCPGVLRPRFSPLFKVTLFSAAFSLVQFC